MMDIARVDTVVRTIKLRAPFKISRAVMEEKQERVFVRIKSSSGHTGFGEAAPLTFFTGETTDTIKLVIDNALGPALIGKNALDVRATITFLDKAIPSNSTAKAAVEMALWDLAGKCLQVPSYRLLGGKLRGVIPVANVIGLSDPKQMATEASEMVDNGYLSIKTKLTGELDEDYLILKTIRKAIGRDVALRADANGAYTVRDAIKAARLFENFDLQYLEQPCAPHLSDALRQIRNYTTTPIAADESMLSTEDAFNLIRTGAADWLIIKLIKLGGIKAALDVATFAAWAGVGCTVVSPVETSIGVAAGLQLAATMPGITVDHELFSPREYLITDFASGLGPVKAELNIPEAPGLGVKVFDDLFKP